MMLRISIAALCALLLSAAGATADTHTPLSQDQVKRFVATLPALEALGAEFDAEGKSDDFAIESRPKAGEPFRPYSNAVAVLRKNHPADHARLANVVKPHGFSTEEWGHVGDRVMIAWMALKMEEEDPRSMQMMEGMDKSMLSMVPPEMREQLEATFAMMETVRNAPEADKRAVAPFKDEIGEYTDAPEQPA